MNTKKHDIRWMVSVALMAAIELLLVSTPLGTINLPIINATIGHIPVIVGAIVLGPLAGGILGGLFGAFMLFKNSVEPRLLSFALSPFIYAKSPFVPNPTFWGGVGTVWISVGCRILIGVISGWIWKLFEKVKNKRIIWKSLALSITAVIGSLVNTITVMGSIYLLFKEQYAQAQDVAITAVWGLVLTTVTTSGIPEAIVAAVVVTAIANVLLKIRIS